MKENIIKSKSYNFALKIIELYKILNSKKEYVLSKQILRCGTSIGANIEESLCAQSKKDFIAKLSIVSKEANETYYWLRLLKDSNYIDSNQASDLLKEINSIIKIISSIILTTKQNLENNP